jgi:hypothetical protein
MEVVTAQQRAATLAGRLDMALNNMSHGLCMLDARGRLVLTNDQALKIFNIRSDEAPVGVHLSEILSGLVRSGVIAPPQLARLTPALSGEGGHGADVLVPLETRDNRAFEITVDRMKSEGTVLVIQDVTERRNAQLEINRMALFDSVTELPNRRCFEEQLALALHPGQALTDGLTVMFLDLDDFQAGQRQPWPPHRRQAAGRDRESAQRHHRTQRSGRALGRRRVCHPSPSRARPAGDVRRRQAHHRRDQPRGGHRRQRGDCRRQHRQRLGA